MSNSVSSVATARHIGPKHHEQHQLVNVNQHNSESDDSSQEEPCERRDFRAKLARTLNSHRFHIVVLVLVAIDCFLVFGELIIDLRLFQDHTCPTSNSTDHRMESEEQHTLEVIEKAFHYTSIGLLALFVVEVILKLVAFGHTFFFKFEEVIDAIIILVSFVLDIIFINNGLLKFMGALIFLRLWRIVRIVHAIITAVMTPMEHRIEVEVKRRTLTEGKLKEAQQEIEFLKRRLVSSDGDHRTV